MMVSFCDSTIDATTTTLVPAISNPGGLYGRRSENSVHRLLKTCLQSASNDFLWAEFVRHSRPLITAMVRGAIRRWTGPAATLVEDLVQETYLKLCANNFRALRDLECEHDIALCGFLKVVASNVVHDHFRSAYSKKRGCGREEEDLEQVPLNMAGCRRSVEDADRRILLDEIDDCLVDRAADPAFARDYAIFWLYYREGFTAKAISELPSVDLTVKGVESLVVRLTRFVKVKLNGAEASQKASNLVFQSFSNGCCLSDLPKPGV